MVIDFTSRQAIATHVRAVRTLTDFVTSVAVVAASILGFAEVTGNALNHGAGYGMEVPCKYTIIMDGLNISQGYESTSNL